MANVGGPMCVMAESLVSEVMDAQAEEACAEGNRGNGCRERPPAAGAGRITLRMPKLRRGTCFPEDIVERCPRTDRAVAAAVSETVAGGVSTGKAGRAVGAMGAGRVPRTCGPLDGAAGDLCGRDLAGAGRPHAWFDAACIVYVKDEASQMASRPFTSGNESFQVWHRHAVPVRQEARPLLAIGDAPILFVGPSKTTRWP